MKRHTKAHGCCVTTLLGTVAFWAALAGCSPALNWRTVAVPEAVLQIALPCKPETATRTVDLAGAPQALSMLGCEADGATFAVSHVRLADPSTAGLALAHWQAATLARLGAGPASPSASQAKSSLSDAGAASAPVAVAAAEGGAGNASSQPFVPPGALALPQAVRTTVQGRTPDGAVVTAHAVWFARASGAEVRVFHALVLASAPRPAVADTFFAGLELK
ncbi:hypothetical protein ACDW_04870 [Acidovorax sp. DW039]|uniref:hypothetical protein n=1 Tax=Acidovorax sp. DW039 TaxID=3095606 RepID=UPI00309253CD|nr:hypothetical protein ACDW_04870 [Acidovorax sp. DW039]